MRTSSKMVGVVAAGMLFLGACGGNDDEPAGNSDETAAETESETESVSSEIVGVGTTEEFCVGFKAVENHEPSESDSLEAILLGFADAIAGVQFPEELVDEGELMVTTYRELASEAKTMGDDEKATIEIMNKMEPIEESAEKIEAYAEENCPEVTADNTDSEESLPTDDSVPSTTASSNSGESVSLNIGSIEEFCLDWSRLEGYEPSGTDAFNEMLERFSTITYTSDVAYDAETLIMALRNVVVEADNAVATGDKTAFENALTVAEGPVGRIDTYYSANC